MSLPPAFPASFYRLLTEGSLKLGVSRTKLVTDAVRYYLKAQERQSTPTAQVLPEELAGHFVEARRKLAKKWWDSLSAEERKARAMKANQARWPKKQ